MAVTVPADAVLTRPAHRLLVRNGWSTDLTTWTELPMETATTSGFQFIRCKRLAFPDVGEATFRYRYGRVNERLYTAPGGTGDPIDGATVAGTKWDPEAKSDADLEIPDYDGWDLIIQEQYLDSDGTNQWETIWVGQIKAMPDTCAPAAAIPQGDTDYIAVESHDRLREWYLDRHWVYLDSTPTTIPADGDNPVCTGHPGYNARVGDRAIGNWAGDGVDPQEFGFDGHTAPGVGSMWTDKASAQHALASATRPPGDAMTFTLHGALELLGSSTGIWEVDRRTSVWELLARICDRRRGRGLMFFDWTVTGTTITPYLRVYPQVLDDLTFTPYGAGSPITIQGANNYGTAVDYDFIGDHRLGAGNAARFNLLRELTTLYDAVTTYGQPIHATVTVANADGSWDPRWTSGEAGVIDTMSMYDRESDPPRWAHVYRDCGLPLDWDFKVGDGAGAVTPDRCDAYTDDDGDMVVPTDTTVVNPSPLMAKLAAHTYLFAGYDYAGSSPARISGDETAARPGIPLMVWRRTSVAPERWVDALEADNLRVAPAGPDGATLKIRDDEFGGDRYLSKDGTAAGIDYVALTVGIELPHILQMYSERSDLGADEPKRIKRIYTPAQLAIIHHKAIYSLDPTTASNGGYPANRGACGATSSAPGILRDDRRELSVIHNLACQWYLQTRRTIAWKIKAACLSGIQDVRQDDCGPITAVDQGNSTFTVAADQTLRMRPGGTFRVRSSPGNDGNYTIASAEYQSGSDVTVVVVEGAIPSGAVGGNSTTTTRRGWPTLGQTIRRVTYSGRTVQVGTPVTSIMYDGVLAETTYETSWADRDFIG